MASDSIESGNTKYFVLALGLLVGFVIGFVMLLSRLPVDSTLTDYHPTQVFGKDIRASDNYDFYKVLPEQVGGNLPVVTDVTTTAQKTVIKPATRVVAGNVQNTQRRNLAAETYAEIPASSIGQESYYLQAGSYHAADDAERMRAAVLMLGFEAFIVKRQDAAGAIGHRVRIGPFFDQDRLTEAKKRLRRGEVKYEIVRVTG